MSWAAKYQPVADDENCRVRDGVADITRPDGTIPQVKPAPRRAADEYAGPGGGQRQEPVGIAEAEIVEFDVQTGGQLREAGRRFHAHGQDDQVKILLL